MKKSILITSIVLAFASCLAASCQQEPEAVLPTSISISPASASIVEGESINLNASVSPSNAEYSPIQWKSSDSKVATVNNGNVTAIAPGEATITASTEGVSGTAKITVTKKVIAVTSVSINESSITMYEGDSAVLSATIEPTDASNKRVDWKTSNDKVVTVDSEGKLTAVKAGEAVITATAQDGGKSADCKVTVLEPDHAVSSISIVPSSLTLIKGETSELKVSFIPENATNKEVTWRSTNEQVATIDKGVVKAINEGKAKIFAKSDDGGFEAYCEVTVKLDDALKGIAFEMAEIELSVGSEHELKVIFTPSYAANKKLYFSSSKTDVASVDDNGLLKALSAGEAVITAKSDEGGFEASCKVKVMEDVDPSGLYYLIGSDLLLNGSVVRSGVAYPPCIDPKGNIYLAEHTGQAYKLGLVKNGKKLYTFDSYKMSEVAYTAASDGNYYIASYPNYYRSGVSVFRLTEDGDVAEFKLYEGSSSYSCKIEKMVTDMQGNAYVCGMRKDEFNVQIATYWKITPNGVVTTVNLTDATQNSDCQSISVSDSGDVYCLVHENTEQLYLFKNGKKERVVSEIYSRWSTENADIQAKAGDLFIVVSESNKQNNTRYYKVMKNTEELYKLLEYEYSTGTSICVSDSGDVYTMGYYYPPEGSLITAFHKNGELLFSTQNQVYMNSIFYKN